MTTVNAVADPHIGNYTKFGGKVTNSINERGHMTLDTFQRAWARRSMGSRLYVAGDLFDYWRIEPQFLRYMNNAFRHVLYLRGNHDAVSDSVEDHALPHESIGNWGGVTMVPFRSGPATEWLPTRLSHNMYAPSTCKTLLIHLGVSDHETPYYLDGVDDSVSIDFLTKLCNQHGFKHVIAGNWHRRRVWENYNGVNVFQVGTLCPNRFEDFRENDAGGFLTLRPDTGDFEIETIEGPRFWKMTQDKARELVDAGGHPEAKWLFLSVSVSSGDYSTFHRYLVDAKEAGIVTGFELHVDQEDRVQAANRARKIVSNANNTGKAVADYIKIAPLDADVDRDNVQRRVDAYLKEAASA